MATIIKDIQEESDKITKVKRIIKNVTILFSALTRMFPKPTFAP